jgi:hypothetical protein
LIEPKILARNIGAINLGTFWIRRSIVLFIATIAIASCSAVLPEQIRIPHGRNSYKVETAWSRLTETIDASNSNYNC